MTGIGKAREWAPPPALACRTLGASCIALVPCSETPQRASIRVTSREVLTDDPVSREETTKIGAELDVAEADDVDNNGAEAEAPAPARVFKPQTEPIRVSGPFQHMVRRCRLN